MALRDAPSGSTGGAALDVGYAPAQQPTGAITIEVRTLSGCADIADAWSQLAARALEPNPFFEPGFALAAVQHLVAFRDVVAILAWQGGARDGQRRLVGLLPCFPRQGLFVPDALIGFSDRRVFNGAPLLDRQQAQAVIAAVLDPSRQRLIEGRGLVLRHVDLAGPLVSSLRQETQRQGLTVSLRPVLSAMGAVAPDASVETSRETLALKGEVTLVESRTQSSLRDAVEIILAMEASGPRAQAGVATLQDTREVGFLRAMTRGLSRARQCRVALLMLDGQPIAGALVIGRGPRGWLYLSAQDQAHAALMPQRVLLAMMRQAAPSRAILLPGGLAASGTDAVSLGDLHLSHGPARKPRDLAGRARAVLRGSLFRRPRAGAA